MTPKVVQVAHHAKCPVAVVPDAWSGDGEGIVVGVDGSDHSERALRWAADEAGRRSTPLTVVLSWGLLDQHHADGVERFDPHYTVADAQAALDAIVVRVIGERSTTVERKVVNDLPARALLERFGCSHLLKRRYRTCSQGERQRVMLARSMMREPRLLLLDEPTSGLDLIARETFVATLGDLLSNSPGLATITVAQPSNAFLVPTGAICAQDGQAVVYLLKAGQPILMAVQGSGTPGGGPLGSGGMDDSGMALADFVGTGAGGALQISAVVTVTYRLD
jgi:ABC-type phosphonate transport system ATPase subunit